MSTDNPRSQRSAAESGDPRSQRSAAASGDPQRPSHASPGYSGPRTGRTVLVAIVTLVLGLVLGYFLGRFSLDYQWRQPTVQITPESQEEASRDNADPTPAAGSVVLRPMPLERSRVAMHERVAANPVAVTVGSLGRSDNEVELHVQLENRGTCEVKSLEGIAYGFDAHERPAKLNRHGENYVAFVAPLPGAKDPLNLLPGAKTVVAEKLRYVDEASLAVAEVTRVTCSDGSVWKKP